MLGKKKDISRKTGEIRIKWGVQVIVIYQCWFLSFDRYTVKSNWVRGYMGKKTNKNNNVETLRYYSELSCIHHLYHFNSVLSENYPSTISVHQSIYWQSKLQMSGHHLLNISACIPLTTVQYVYRFFS